MSTFNPQQLENIEVTDALDTRMIPVPAGDYTGVVDSYKLASLPSGSVVLEVNWSIDDDEVRRVTGRDENKVRQAVFLDITETGTLDMGKGKNVQLGRLREALGQNTPGKPWKFGDLIGQVALTSVSHTPNKNNPEITYPEIRRVAKLS